MARELRCPTRERSYRGRGCGGTNLRVVRRNGGRSAFNGYNFKSSDWSEVICLDCGRSWKTKSNVRNIADVTDEELRQALDNRDN